LWKGSWKVSDLSRRFGWLLYGLASIACLLLMALILLICADVTLRTVNRTGVPWANEVSEYVLYLITFLSAPMLLRQGQHVRVDLILRALPPRIAWCMEWIVDISGVAISAIFFVSSLRAASASYTEASLVMKGLSFPEWWLLVPVPACMLLMSVEFAFRLHRLVAGERKMREEATSVA
jgi:TRAP-type C4-dicarboxylate transport system permease small subunit